MHIYMNIYVCIIGSKLVARPIYIMHSYVQKCVYGHIWTGSYPKANLLYIIYSAFICRELHVWTHVARVVS